MAAPPTSQTRSLRTHAPEKIKPGVPSRVSTGKEGLSPSEFGRQTAQLDKPRNCFKARNPTGPGALHPARCHPAATAGLGVPPGRKEAAQGRAGEGPASPAGGEQVCGEGSAAGRPGARGRGRESGLCGAEPGRCSRYVQLI